MSRRSEPRTARERVFKILLLGLLLGGWVAATPVEGATRDPVLLPDGSDVEIEREVEFGRTAQQTLKLDIYRPKHQPPSPIPAIVMIHGGGWKSWPDGKWTKETDAGIAKAIAAHGYWVCSIDYRLSDVAKFPAALTDCKTAVRWIRANAARLGVDSDHIGAWGFSAGAHLALLVGCGSSKNAAGGASDGSSEMSRLQAVSAWAPLTDLAQSQGSCRLEGECKELAQKFLGGGLEELPSVYREASPVLQASSAFPPTLLVHGDRDALVPFSHSEVMCRRLRELGVRASLLTVKEGGHLLFQEEGQQPGLSEIVKATLDFFDLHLKHPRVLLFTQSAGFVHDVVKRAAQDKLCLVEEQLTKACAGQIDLTTTQDPGAITRENLKKYGAVVFYTSGELPIDKEALLDYVRAGGGFVCVHNAMATLMKYPPYSEMVGGYFDGHPWNQEITVTVEDSNHPSTELLGKSFRIKDEIYQVKSWDRKAVHVLLSVDPASVDLTKGKREDKDYALAWTKSYGQGRIFYTALGHYAEVWKDERFLKHLVGGLRWAAGGGP